MSAGYLPADDARGRSADEVRRAEDLFRGRDVVGVARKQIKRNGDRSWIERAAEGDEFSLREFVVLEQLLDCLQVVAPG